MQRRSFRVLASAQCVASVEGRLEISLNEPQMVFVASVKSVDLLNWGLTFVCLLTLTSTAVWLGMLHTYTLHTMWKTHSSSRKKTMKNLRTQLRKLRSGCLLNVLTPYWSFVLNIRLFLRLQISSLFRIKALSRISTLPWGTKSGLRYI